MTAKEIERLLASLTGFGAARLDQTTRALRAAAILPRSPRGRGAKPLTALDVARFLIGVAAVDQPADAPDAVRQYAPMRRQGGAFPGETFDVALTHALADAALAASVRTILVCRSWPMATITLVSSEENRFVPEALPTADPAATSLNRIDEAPVFCGIRTPLLLALARSLAI